MATITFPDRETELEGLGFLMEHFSYHVRRKGEIIETILPDAALEALRREGIPFTVNEMANHEDHPAPPVRGAAAAKVQRRKIRSAKAPRRSGS
jgi:hypothetical protein